MEGSGTMISDAGSPPRLVRGASRAGAGLVHHPQLVEEVLDGTLLVVWDKAATFTWARTGPAHEVSPATDENPGQAHGGTAGAAGSRSTDGGRARRLASGLV
jgi:hypothetical protein